MRQRLPLFSHLFGLHPWDVDRLTLEQFEDYCAYAESFTRSREADDG